VQSLDDLAALSNLLLHLLILLARAIFVIGVRLGDNERGKDIEE